MSVSIENGWLRVGDRHDPSETVALIRADAVTAVRPVYPWEGCEVSYHGQRDPVWVHGVSADDVQRLIDSQRSRGKP